MLLIHHDLQSRLVVVPATVGVAEVVRVSDAANAALMRLVSLARERPDAFKVRFTPTVSLFGFIITLCSIDPAEI